MFGHDNQDKHHDEDANAHADNGQHDDQAASQQYDDAAAAVVDDATTVAPTAQDAGLGSFEATPVAPIASPVAATDDLLDIKQEALQALTPLVGQLDQTPEEQFRTTMMMIQASDDHSLVRVAYAAAKQISNEKERAQALLDIVNEINYFTQQHQA